MPAAMVQASASSSASSESVSRAVNLTRVCAETSVAESMRAVAKRPLQGPLRGGPAPTEARHLAVPAGWVRGAAADTRRCGGQPRRYAATLAVGPRLPEVVAKLARRGQRKFAVLRVFTVRVVA